jgi:hypothetical protein
MAEEAERGWKLFIACEYFSLQQDDKNLEKTYSSMIRICDELNQYQSITDIPHKKKQHKNMHVIRFLSALVYYDLSQDGWQSLKLTCSISKGLVQESRMIVR